MISISMIFVSFSNEQRVRTEQVTPVNEAPSQETLAQIENVEDFSLDIKFLNGDEVEYEYEVKTDRIEAEIERKINGMKDKIVGEQALAEIQSLIEKVKPTSVQTVDQLADQFLKVLNLKREDIKAFELEIHFSDRKKINYKF